MDTEGITWLASFPKSGNTWVRAFISAYHFDTDVNINNLFGVLSDQAMRWYQACCSEPCHELSEAQLALVHPAAMLNMQQSINMTPKLVKTHHANMIVHGVRLIPPQVTEKVMYLIRDPRDVAHSYARHYGVDLSTAVDMMSDPKMKIFADGDTTRAPHFTMSWAHHVRSYVEATDIKVSVVKYEQLREDPEKMFTWILEWIGVEDVDPARVQRALERVRLDRLRAQEERDGFVEASHKAPRFFGDGKTGQTLPADLQEKLEAHAGEVMEAMGYKRREEAAA